MSRLKKVYQSEVIPEMKKKYNLKNAFEVPKIEKVVINCGFGKGSSDQKLLEYVMQEIANIVGQRPTKTTAKKAISNFKIRQGMSLGCKATLRSDRMYEFLDRLINIALPRIRDFRGIPSKAFDKSGNYTFGIKDQIIFPEVEADQVQAAFGMDISIVIKNNSKEDKAERNRELLTLLGMPFTKN